MRGQRSRLTAVALLALLGCTAGLASAMESQNVLYSYHDSVPDQRIAINGSSEALGLFFFPTENEPYLLSGISFYHGGLYSPLGHGWYRLYLVRRTDIDGYLDYVTKWPRASQPPLETTCQDCWEHVEIPTWAFPIQFGGDTVEDCVGLFVRPEDTVIHYDPPALWIDAETDADYTSTWISITDQGENTHSIDAATYSEIGDLLIEVEIWYIDSTPLEGAASFSTIKSLYRP